MENKLIELVSEKITLLERFREATSRILYEDIDNMERLLDERDEIIRASDEISRAVKQHIGSLPAEQQGKLKDTLRLKNRKDYPELHNITNRLEQLKLELKEQDEKALERLKSLQSELLDEMSEAKKTKQVTDYFSQTSIDLTKGSNLNIKN